MALATLSIIKPLMSSGNYMYHLLYQSITLNFVFMPSKVVRFQVLTAASMMFRAVFWVVLPCKMIVRG
jgi:hypothetical protein